jgi:hypothetical protein
MRRVMLEGENEDVRDNIPPTANLMMTEGLQLSLWYDYWATDLSDTGSGAYTPDQVFNLRDKAGR